MYRTNSIAATGKNGQLTSGVTYSLVSKGACTIFIPLVVGHVWGYVREWSGLFCIRKGTSRSPSGVFPPHPQLSIRCWRHGKANARRVRTWWLLETRRQCRHFGGSSALEKLNRYPLRSVLQWNYWNLSVFCNGNVKIYDGNSGLKFWLMSLFLKTTFQ